MINQKATAMPNVTSTRQKTFSRRRLAIRQSMLVVSIACALGLIAACVQIYADHSRQADNIQVQSTKQLASIKESATNALIELNENLATAITKGLLGHEMFMEAKLETPNGYVLAAQSRGRMTTMKAEIAHYLFGDPKEQLIDLTYDDGANRLNVGRLVVVVDTCSVGAEFLDRAIITLISGFLRSLALAAILLIAFYLTLTRPLSSLASQINNLNLRDRPGERVSLPNDNDIEDLQTIASATNTHLQLIEKHVREIDAGREILRGANLDLEKKVQERTSGLTKEIEERLKAENKLRHALQSAEANATAKTQFLANMSHELRTPLNAVIGYSEFLTLTPEQVTPAMRREYLTHIKDSGHRLLNLVNNILDLTRLSEGKMPIKISAVNVNELCSEAATYLEPLVVQNNNSIVFDLDPDIQDISTDEDRLKQVLINLVGNAAKFTKNGKLTIKSSFFDPKKQVVYISVEDTGVGIPAKDIENIFDNFTQVDSSLHRNFDGSGLGLSIVRENCDLLGWDIKVESTLDVGTRFMLRVPVHYEKAA